MTERSPCSPDDPSFMPETMKYWRERAEHAEIRLAEAEKMIERKNLALARPCISCGYRPKIVQPAVDLRVE